MARADHRQACARQICTLDLRSVVRGPRVVIVSSVESHANTIARTTCAARTLGGRRTADHWRFPKN